MKKFVGYVNGKSFNNEEDFNKAAQEAIKSGEDNLSITSYYSYTSDDEKQIEDEKDPKFVNASDYVLNDRKPDVVNADYYEYTVSDELNKKIKDASNKDAINENANYYLSHLDDSIDYASKKSVELQKEIENLQSKLYENENTLKDVKAKKKYYNTILDILDKSAPVEDDGTEEKKEKTPVTDDKVRKVLGIDKSISLFDFLNQLGFLR